MKTVIAGPFLDIVTPGCFRLHWLTLVTCSAGSLAVTLHVNYSKVNFFNETQDQQQPHKRWYLEVEHW